MSEQEILEGNRLIAEFMEVDRFEAGSWQLYIQITNGSYHSSWDWLMPVIDKIYSSDDYVKYKRYIEQFSDGIIINTKYIDSTYNQVVDYLKWYNSYKTVLQEQNKNKQ